METRYYQEEAKAAFFEDYEQNPIGGSGLIYAATGAGKTVIGADIGKSLNQPLLFLVHRDELAEQTISKFLAVWKGVDIGLVKAKHNQLGATVTVASIQTLANEKRLQALLDAKKYSLVIQDECFPAGTLVDGKPIEQIRVGDYVDSFNHSTGQIEKKRVDQIMKKKMPDHMFKLSYDDKILICTPNHPIYVNHKRTGFEGYALAEDLHLSKGVSVYAKPSEVCEPRSMQRLGSFFKKLTLSQLQKVWLCLLFGILQKGICSQKKLRNNEIDKSWSERNSFKTHERKQSFFQSFDKGEGQPIIKSDWSQTQIAGWQWNGVDGTSKIVTSEVVAHDITSFYPRNGDQDKNKRSPLSSMLQSGYRLLGFDVGNRSGRKQPHIFDKKSPGQEKTGVLRRTRLDCVEILEQRDYDGCFGGIGENYVYNISVEDNHNYFANGILVHNCHHAPSPTWEKVLRSVPAYRLGLTATPVRSDEVALDGLFSKVLYKYSVIDGIKDGYLVDIQGRQIDINMNLDGIKCQAGDFNAMALADVMTNKQVMDVVYTKWNEYASNLKTVAFCCDVNHAKLSAEYFSLRGVNAEWIAGSMDYDTRKAVLRRFSRGQTQVLFNCMILTEGWDEPSIESVMMLRPTSSQSLYCLDDKTEILTKDGWKGIVDGIDNVACFDVETEKIKWSSANKIIRKKYVDESFFGIENPGLSIAVTNKHNMVYKARRTSKKHWSLSTADSLPSEFNIPCAGFQDAKGVALTDPELRFIGLFLTDGTINKITNQIIITQSHRHLFCLEFIEKTLSDCGFKYSVGYNDKPTNFGERKFPLNLYMISKGKPRGTDKHKTGWEKLAEFITKDYQDWFEDLTREQLIILLEAMYIGDGRKKINEGYESHTYSICTARKDFADKIQSLCTRRGMRCNVIKQDHVIFNINVSTNKSTRSLTTKSSDSRPVFSIREDITSDFVWCVETDLGTIVTRRNGKVAITGNCQMLGRGLRLYPGKSALVVLDFIGATQKHKLMQFGDLTGVPYPKVAKVKPTGEPMDKYMPSVRDVLIADDKAIDVYKNQARAFNWVRSGDNLALQIGFNHYLVVRPGAESGYEAVNCHLVAWQYQEKVIYKASTVDICLSVAEEQAENLAKKKDALSFQQADREFGQRVTQKQAEMLSKYKQPVPATAKEAASMIGKLFFDTFQRKANAIASPDLRNMIKAQQYQGMLGCKISLEQIDKLKQIEAEKIQKFYLNGGGFKRWR